MTDTQTATVRDLEAGNWVLFTKRTEDPKLSWLQARLTEAGIANKRQGYSFHGPILLVDAAKEDAAWDILTPVDNVDDDDPRFVVGAA